MRKILFALLFSGISATAFAQTSFSFSCTKDTTIFCGPPCIDIRATIPDIHAGTGSYNTVLVNPNSSCYQPYVPTNTPGAPDFGTLTTDDVYSQPINIGFNFTFFGNVYTQVVASTNGYISFDLAKAGLFSHFTVNADLPSTSYDRALIMGPYHDLDPSSRANPPASMLIKYEVLGTTPYRRWVFSFNDVPLYSTTAATCGALNQNKHQIVLYETLNIVEVFIQNKQICLASGGNNGKAICGIQDFNRTTGYMAPNRAFSSAAWGSIGMNEEWRFVPSGGAATFKFVELYDLSNNLIATGTATSNNNGTMNAVFTNVCAAPNTTTAYVVKSAYADPANPLLSIFGTDTIQVTRQNTLPVTGSATATNCGTATGTITASVTAGAGTPPYQFSIDGGPLGVNNFFTGLTAGPHQLLGVDFNGCQKTITVFVPTNNNIPATATATATSCPGVNNGTITVNPGGGTAPYTYTLGAVTQSSNVFTGLMPGTYTVNFTDNGGCAGTATATVTAGAGLTGTGTFTNTGCANVNNGTASATPTNGTGPFQYSINGGGTYQAGNSFTGLAPNNYTITFKDANGCLGTVSGTVAAGASLTSNISSTPPTCAGFTNGSITVTPTSGAGPYSFSLNGGPTQPSGTFNGLGTGSYTITFTDGGGCTGSNGATLTPVSPLTDVATPQDANCFGDANGSITMNPSGGTTPYSFSINGGVSFQSSPTFSGLTANNYTIRTKDANGCIVNTPVTINQPTALTGSASATPSTCNGNDGIITFTTNAGGTSPYLFSIDSGVTYQSGATFIVSPATYNNLLVKDAHGCTANVAGVTVTLNDTMRLSFGPDQVACQGTPTALNPLTNSATSIFNWTPVTGLNSPTSPNPLASPTDSTTYTLVAKWGLCQRTASTRLNILTKPVAHAGKDTAICFQTFALLRGSATRTSGAVDYLWTPSAKAFPSTTASTVGRPDSTQVFTLQVSDNYGCNFKVFDDVLVTMQPPVPAFAGNDTNAVYGIPHQLFSSGGVSYLWSPSNNLDNPFSQYPKATLTSDTRFIVLITDIAGCLGTDDVLIKVYKGPTYYVPNAFTPNGDGRNDVFRPTPVGIVKTDYFRVFNRYGQLIFETTKWLDGWNGKFKGQAQPQGAYTWMIRGTDRDGKVVEMKGTVLLLP